MKYEELVDQKDLKIKHASGEYVNMVEVEPDDIVFLILSKGKKRLKYSEVNKFFGEEKKESLESSIQYLFDNGFAIKEVIDEMDYQIILQ